MYEGSGTGRTNTDEFASLAGARKAQTSKAGGPLRLRVNRIRCRYRDVRVFPVRGDGDLEGKLHCDRGHRVGRMAQIGLQC